jgi:thymidylate synthase
MNTIDKKYTDLLQDILDKGVQKKDRTGTGTISVFGRQIRHDMKEGFPLLTTKKMHWKSIVAELLWFLRGDTNIKYLVDNDCHIWDGDAYKNYEKSYAAWVGDSSWSNNGEPWDLKNFIRLIKEDKRFCSMFGDLGPIYGKQWREWVYETRENKEDSDVDSLITGMDVFDGYRYLRSFDQIQNLIKDLKKNPDSRRLMVNAWNVGEIDEMVLPPCHYGFQVYTRELSFNERYDLLKEKTNENPLKYSDENGNYPEHIQKPVLKWMENENIPTRASSLMWNQRSVDTFLGLPFNIASYGLLLEILAKEVNMVPDELIGNLGDVHLYTNHIEQAKEQIGRDLTEEERYNIWFNNNYETGMERFFDPNNLPDYENSYYDPTPKRTREPYSLPKLNIKLHFKNDPSFTPEHWLVDDFVIEDYKSHPAIKAPLSN